jgi:hypothetical protein
LVRISDAELKSIDFRHKAPADSQTIRPSFKPVAAKIDVLAPGDQAKWESGKEYEIRWKPITADDVRIVLVGHDGTSFPIAERTANSGSYRFQVPRNWGPPPDDYDSKVRVMTLDGRIWGDSKYFRVYSWDVALSCFIKYVTRYESRIRYGEELEFDIGMANLGTLAPVTIQNVLVQITKQPENAVLAQEEWGFSGIYPGVWYKLSEPRRFDIWSTYYMQNYFGNWEEGSIRIQVWLDPQNQLGENSAVRQRMRNPAFLDIKIVR